MQDILSAVQAGDIQEVAEKLSNVDDVNALFKGETMLTTSAKIDDVDLVKLLLDSGCDPLIRNNKGQSAADIAMLTGKTKCYEVIAKAAESALSKLELNNYSNISNKPK